MNVVRRDFKELKNEVPVLFVHKCHQCVLEHSLPQSESNLQARQNLWMPCVPSSHTFAFVAVLQTGAEKGRSSNIMMTGSCRSSSLLP